MEENAYTVLAAGINHDGDEPVKAVSGGLHIAFKILNFTMFIEASKLCPFYSIGNCK